LIRPCILAGAPVGATILDPFSGSGTTGQVALEVGRRYLGIELNMSYVDLTIERLSKLPANDNQRAAA
jgi:site-specific DNA-methyltransferase (adenine-specific)